MSPVVRFLLTWFAASAAVGPFVGTFLAHGHRHATPQVVDLRS